MALDHPRSLTRMTDADTARRLETAMLRIGARMQRSLKRTLMIPPEPSPLPSPDDPLHDLLRAQHRLIAHLRGRSCRCGTCG